MHRFESDRRLQLSSRGAVLGGGGGRLSQVVVGFHL